MNRCRTRDKKMYKFFFKYFKTFDIKNLQYTYNAQKTIKHENIKLNIQKNNLIYS